MNNQAPPSLRLPTQDSSTGRGIKTFFQVIVGFVIGLAVTIWTVPGVPSAVIVYLQHNLLQILLIAGVPSGIASFIWNLFRKGINTY